MTGSTPPGALFSRERGAGAEGRTAVVWWGIHGSAGSLDDVPADAVGLPAAEEEPPDG